MFKSTLYINPRRTGCLLFALTLPCCTSAVRSSPFSIRHQLTSAIRPPGSIDPLITLWGDNYTICKLPDGIIDACVTRRSPTLNSFRNKHLIYKKCTSIRFGLRMKCIIKMGELCRCHLQHCRVCVFFLCKGVHSRPQGSDVNTNWAQAPVLMMERSAKF